MVLDDRPNSTDAPVLNADVVVKGRNVEIPAPFQGLCLGEVVAAWSGFDRTIYLFDVELDPRTPEQTGRVSTAVNTLTLGAAFLVQAAIGWILDLWPRTASDGWDPDGYSWALALSAALQALAALAMATAQRRGR